MILFVNERGEIKDIDSTEDKSLKELEITGNNPFEGWSDARIRCYRVEVRDGEVVMMTPYVSSILLDQHRLSGEGHTGCLRERHEYTDGTHRDL